MSIQAIQNYYKEYHKIKTFGATNNERSLNYASYNLINAYCEKRKLMLVAELNIINAKNEKKRPDGTIRSSLCIDYGHWECKDLTDNIEEEILNKFNIGYPKMNILFENGDRAILFQEGERVMDIDMHNEKELDKILNQFVSYEHPSITNFNQAVEQFKEDIPNVVKALHEMIAIQSIDNQPFIDCRNDFFELCKHSINPTISIGNINEMLIQHILTEEIFNSIFSDTQVVRENNIAKELYRVEDTFFRGQTKRQTLESIKNYYEVIKIHAASITDHHKKQSFLKAIYENFYKAYNPKGADKLGIVYTPNEIVKFQIESVDYLLYKHFNKTLSCENVDILDPATGTGTYICELIEHLAPQYLEHKYKYEIHANEVAILPYYIATLNIEYTYRQKMGKYVEFDNICFVDTLDNVSALGYEGKMNDIYGFSAENAQRIKDQNQRKISVVLGNPPYNANQQNENDNNKNRLYKVIDERIKDTYIKYSTAQKTKVYDMYARFFRWATDRLHDDGIVAFITNRSFINSRTFDGFRSCIRNEFDYCYIIDTQSDVRANPKIAGTTHNVFGIQTGVAVMFLVKNKENVDKKCKIHYYTLSDEQRKEEKLRWFSDNQLEKLRFDFIQPDKNNNWINLADDNDFENLLPLCSKDTKFSKAKNEENALFKLFSLGVVSSRDEWVYDFKKQFLKEKVNYFMDTYRQEIKRWKKSDKNEALNDFVDRKIKWTSELEEYMKKGKALKFNAKQIIKTVYRPFVTKFLYYDRIIIHRFYQNEKIWGLKNPYQNLQICISGTSSNKPFQTIATNILSGLDFLEKTQCLPLYRYSESGVRMDNITDWGLEQFKKNYELGITNYEISKESIFYYVYAVLHNPVYRKKYELNLKREFPRIPFYKDFEKWSSWGKELMDLHLNYENVEPFLLKVSDPLEGSDTTINTKVKLKANKESGEIVIDEQTTLSGIPNQAWEYQLGTRSALEWILDQYKEKEPADETIKAQFNTYQFADYKEQVIDLLKRVCTVSIKTVEIMNQLRITN